MSAPEAQVRSAPAQKQAPWNEHIWPQQKQKLWNETGLEGLSKLVDMGPWPAPCITCTTSYNVQLHCKTQNVCSSVDYICSNALLYAAPWIYK